MLKLLGDCFYIKKTKSSDTHHLFGFRLEDQEEILSHQKQRAAKGEVSAELGESRRADEHDDV